MITEQPIEDKHPWFNRIHISQEFFKDNGPWTLKKVTEMFQAFHPQYPVKGFLVSRYIDPDPDQQFKDDLMMDLFFVDEGSVMISFKHPSRFPKLHALCARRAMNDHKLLNQHMAGKPNIQLGFNNDDFEKEKLTMRIKYKFA